MRKRHYRLFESNIDATPATPSATRVRVDSSPVASSPLRFLSHMLGDPSAESRAHPDPTRDVWELAVWDPIPVCLHLFCLFSPGHVLVYALFLPTTTSDPHPSITVVKTLVLQILLSVQLLLLKRAFSQQEKDSAIIHKEVMSEYDTKFVHPRLNPVVRDVATQFNGDSSLQRDTKGEVQVSTPTVIIKREFRTNPNPNYIKHIDAENPSSLNERSFSPVPFQTMTHTVQDHSLVKPRPQSLIQNTHLRRSVAGTPTRPAGDGGSLGIYSHANSPLKKAISMSDMQSRETPRNSFQMASREIQDQKHRSPSPTKLQSQPSRRLFNSNDFTAVDNQRPTSTANALGVRSRHSTSGKAPPRW